MTKKNKTYTPAPTIPPHLVERYQVVLDVIAGKLSVSDGARKLNLARNHFQKILHEGEAAILSAITPKAGGRPKKPARETELENELEKLRAENARLKDRVDTTTRMMEIAGGLLKGTIRPTGRAPVPKSRKDPEGESDDDHIRKLEAARMMRSLGLSRMLAAAAVGCGASTIARWAQRARRGAALVEPRGPSPCTETEPERAVQLEAIVRESRGLMGADSLRHSVPGSSRREAARVKAATLQKIEEERRAETTRVTITKPGVIRGFDAMHLAKGFLLVAADACIPFRTSVVEVENYSAREVASALAADFATHGAPLVARLDRARQHVAPEVLEIYDQYGVLVLQGPPFHAPYYGQLERQNREHRAWLKRGEKEIDRMLVVVNRRWKRAILSWRSAEDLWLQRAPIVEDRRALREEVVERAARIRHELGRRGENAAQSERFAIEAALEQRGYLRRKIGGWC